MVGLPNFLIETAVPIYIRPARNIGGISATVTVAELGEDELEITQHPVQTGASITDHAYKKPSKLEITALWNDQLEPLSEIYQDLLDLQNSRTPFTVVTGKRIYNNMLLKSIGVTTERETENILSVRAVLQEVLIVNVETTTVAPRDDQAFPGTTDSTANAGDKSAQSNPQASNAVNKLFLNQGGTIPQPPPRPAQLNGLFLG